MPGLTRAALAAVVANVAIIMTGAIVRLTESGLGCPDWPTCEGRSIVPEVATAQWHTYIEFGNRLMSFVVLAAAVWVVLAARREARDRRGLWRLALVQPTGVLIQAVLGGITVLSGLSPLVVAAHLLASMALLAAAVVLHDRAAAVPVTPVRGLGWVTGVMVAAAGVVLVLGTLVTAAGPHSGGEAGTTRLGLDIRTFAVAHADAVWLLVGLTIAALVVAHGHRAVRAVRAAQVLLAIEVVQGGIGYAQYALGIPPLPVAFHVLGAALVWIATWRLALAVRAHPNARDGSVAPGGSVAAADDLVGTRGRVSGGSTSDPSGDTASV